MAQDIPYKDRQLLQTVKDMSDATLFDFLVDGESYSSPQKMLYTPTQDHNTSTSLSLKLPGKRSRPSSVLRELAGGPFGSSVGMRHSFLSFDQAITHTILSSCSCGTQGSDGIMVLWEMIRV